MDQHGNRIPVEMKRQCDSCGLFRLCRLAQNTWRCEECEHLDEVALADVVDAARRRMLRSQVSVPQGQQRVTDIEHLIHKLHSGPDISTCPAPAVDAEDTSSEAPR